MSKYVPRLTAPSTSDKNWIRFDKGGYNYCIEISNGSCLPNCVGYAWGRWRELLGAFHKLSRGNAENWWANTSDGYERGQTPKVGAVMCWRKGQAGVGSDGAGHVAIVEQVEEDGKTVLTSESAYGGARWYNKKRAYPYNLGSTYAFQGFIYLPINYETEPTKTDEPTSTKKTNLELAQEVLEGKWGNGADRRAKLTAAGYDFSAVQTEVNKLVSKQSTTKKTNTEIAKEVLAGKWGNGAERRKRLTEAGYNPSSVQAIVNRLNKK